MKALRTFKEASRKLEREYFPTMLLSFIHINNVIKKIYINNEDSIIVKDLKVKIKDFVDTIVLENITIYHKFALFLFLPTNRSSYFNVHKKNIISECKEKMFSIYLKKMNVTVPLQYKKLVILLFL